MSTTHKWGYAVNIFAAFGRRSTATDPEVSTTQRPDERLGLPHRFEAVGEALISGSDISGPCQVAGQDLARDGASLQEVLEGLRSMWRHTRREDPSFEAVSALLAAWSETTLGYLHQLSCEDALTGLSSQAHLRSRLSEIDRARDGEATPPVHALVVCEAPFGDDPAEESEDHFTRAMRLARVGELARTVFARDETIARIGTHRVAVLVERDDRLGRRVKLLRTLLDGMAAGDGTVRVWIEGLPPTDAGAAMLLDELARD